MNKKISRKDFLKRGALSTAALGVANLTLPSVSRASEGGELATLIDISKCIGCEACVSACAYSNEAKFPNPQKPFPRMYPDRVKVFDWSEKRDVSNRLTPYNWLYIQKARVTVNNEEKTLTIPRRCMHCQNPPCVSFCPFGSAYQKENGISIIDSEICLGGAKCKSVCPWKIPERQTGIGIYLDLLPSLAGNGVMYKCDRCHDLIAGGGIPMCIEACPQDVQKIGPREDIVKEAKAIAAEKNAHLYGIDENGGTNTIYISPVTFEELNRAIKKGPGRPHFNPVKNTMASANNLAKAILIAPIAGFCAAALSNMNMIKKIFSKSEVQEND